MDIVESEQFILTQVIKNIVDFQAVEDAKGTPYSNLIRLVSKEPQLIFSKLLATESDVYLFFNNLTSLQKSFLIPKIEIYKKGKNGEDIPIVFRSHFDGDEYNTYAFSTNKSLDINSLQGRQDGVGLKKISITDRNENQADVNIEVKMDFFFDNVLALANSSFKELITVPEIRTNKSERDFRIKLVIGWETPIDASGDVFSGDDLDIIEKSNIVYLLNLTTHNISFSENGNVNITINYQGSTEKTFSHNPDYDILALNTEDKINFFHINASDDPSDPIRFAYTTLCLLRDQLEKKLEVLYTANPEIQSDSLKDKKEPSVIDEKIKTIEEDKEKVDKKIEELELIVIKYKYMLILNSIFYNNRACCIDVPFSILEAFTKETVVQNDNLVVLLDTLLEQIGRPKTLIGSSNAVDNDRAEMIAKLQELHKTVNKATEDELKNVDLQNDFIYDVFTNAASGVLPALAVLSPVNGSNIIATELMKEMKRINYITLGDLLNTVLSFLPASQEADIILGPCKIGDFIINLAQFPISINNFVIWFTNNVIKTVRKQYFLWDFIKDITNDLIKSNLMGMTFHGHSKINANIMVSSISSTKQLEKGKLYTDDDHIVSLLSRNIANTEKIYSYFVLYIYDYNLDKRDGDPEMDMKDGIYHFTIGNSVGILKTAAFNKIDFPRMKDMRIVDGQLQKPGSLLKEHYSLDMKTIGCPLFVNGQTLYYDASYLGLLGRKAAEDLGLGGYYLVTGIETTIGQDGYENSVKCVWNAQRQPSKEEINIIVNENAKNNINDAKQTFDRFKQGTK